MKNYFQHANAEAKRTSSCEVVAAKCDATYVKSDEIKTRSLVPQAFCASRSARTRKPENRFATMRLSGGGSPGETLFDK